MSKYSRPKTGFAALDKKWKFHKTHCVSCAVAKSLDACCNAGVELYRARLNAPDAAMRMKTVKPGTE